MQDLGRGLQNFGLGISRIADYLQDQIDDAAAGNAYNNFAEAARKIEADHDALAGEAALKGLGSAESALAAQRRAIEGRLANDVQRRVFAARADVRESQSRSVMYAHSVAAAKAYEIGSLKAGIDNSIEDYVKFALQDPQAAALHKALAQQKLNDLAERTGGSEEQKTAAWREATNRMHTAVLDQLVAMNQTGSAKSYLSDVPDNEMTQESRVRMQELVRRADVGTKTLNLMFDIERVATARGGTTREQEAYAMAVADETYKGKRITAEEYDGLLRRIKTRYGDRRENEAQAVAEELGAAEKFLLENKDKSIEDLSPSTKDVLVRHGLWPRLQNFSEEGRWSTNLSVRAEIERMTPEQHRAMTNSEFGVWARTNLNNVDLSYARALRAKALGQNLTPELVYSLTQKQRIHRAARELGIDTERDDEATLAFEETFNDRLISWQTATGKKATDQDVQMLLDTIVKDRVKVETTRWSPLYGRVYAMGPLSPDVQEVPMFNLPKRASGAGIAYVTTSGGQRVEVDDIPPKHMNAVRRALEDRYRMAPSPGNLPTFQNIAEAWVLAGSPK